MPQQLPEISQHFLYLTPHYRYDVTEITTIGLNDLIVAVSGCFAPHMPLNNDCLLRLTVETCLRCDYEVYQEFRSPCLSSALSLTEAAEEATPVVKGYARC